MRSRSSDYEGERGDFNNSVESPSMHLTVIQHVVLTRTFLFPSKSLISFRHCIHSLNSFHELLSDGPTSLLSCLEVQDRAGRTSLRHPDLLMKSDSHPPSTYVESGALLLPFMGEWSTILLERSAFLTTIPVGSDGIRNLTR